MTDVVFTTSCPGCGLTFDGVPGGPNCPNCHAELPGYVGAEEPGWVDQSPDPSVLVHSWASEGDPAIEQTGVSSVTPSQMPWTPPPDPVEPAAPEPPAENAAVAAWVDDRGQVSLPDDAGSVQLDELVSEPPDPVEPAAPEPPAENERAAEKGKRGRN